MAKFVVDAGVALHLASEDLEVAEGHRLLAPTLLRSQVLSALHEAVHRGELAPGRADLARGVAGEVANAPVEALV